uniref:SCP domain-containing protein n=1 Tax=Haemonchus contortus TaxID=6289 RepID=A0A7I4Z1M2_HAECO
MFFVFTAFAFLLVSVADESFKSPLSKEGMKALWELSKDCHKGLIRYPEFVNKSLEWINSPRDTPNAAVKIRSKVCVPKTMPEYDAIMSFFKGQFDRRRQKINSLGPGALFGCNGIVNNRRETKKCITVACLFRKKIR